MGSGAEIRKPSEVDLKKPVVVGFGAKRMGLSLNLTDSSRPGGDWLPGFFIKQGRSVWLLETSAKLDLLRIRGNNRVYSIDDRTRKVLAKMKRPGG